MFWKRKKIKYAAVNKAGDDDIDLDHPRKSVFTPSCVRSSLLTAVLLCTYFAPSIVLTFYQRWLFQEILILVLAVLWNGDRMSIVNATGLFVCLTGIVAHVVHKIGNAQQATAGADGFPTRVYEKDTSTGDERDEMSSKSLMEKAPASFLVSDSEAEGDQNDSMDLFNILNRHDR
ncbi:hypothetical protein MML48_1g16487 [Holotrichia oblita]|uniref:Uncharacterized protein n=1 Tax=Holotrichia oblita TaxID=644536 RepID=A0ACB9TYP0_HOLOL|nr:hypothetical protein MML48_1g16487 [Holotrichia oblita]